jgi:hypothetical protein
MCRHPRRVDDVPVSKPPKLTRAERRERRASAPGEGVYGVDVTDAGADSWTGRYLVWARTPDEAKEHVRTAGFHKKQVERQWTPSNPPPEGVPDDLAPDVQGWRRSRLNDDGWSAWEPLGAAYRHPPQGLAAVDPSVR